MFPGVHITVDQTFTSAQEVAAVTTRLISSRVPTFAIEKVVTTCFPPGKTDARLPIMLETDGYNNIGKAESIRGMYFVMWGEDDAMMPPSFAERLFQAHYKGVVEEAGKVAEEAEPDPKRIKNLLYKLGLELQDFKSEPLADQCRLLQKTAATIDLERLAAKKTCRIAHGEHGCFFGDDPASSRVYESYLCGLGFIKDPFAAHDEEIVW